MKHHLISELKTQILVLPAHHGDSIIIKTFDFNGNEFNILVDGGTAKTFEEVLKKELKKISLLNIVILTHIDSDHIGGLIKFVKNTLFDPKKIEKYWFNSKNIRFLNLGDNISSGQAKTFEELLIDKGDIKDKWADEIIIGNEPILPSGINIEIISPSKEILEKLYKKWPDLSEEYNKKLQDVAISTIASSQINRGLLVDLALVDDRPDKSIIDDIVNSSSIAFIFNTFDISVLFLSDAHPYLIQQALSSKGYSKENKLKIDFLKVSHHGSKNNTTNDLLDMIECDKFIISTNGGNSGHTHPDRETIARIIHHPERKKEGYQVKRKIYLNYSIENIQRKAGEFINDADLKTGNWEVIDNTQFFENE